MQHLETKQNEEPQVVQAPKQTTAAATSLSSILEDDNDEREVTKFAGAVSE